MPTALPPLGTRQKTQSCSSLHAARVARTKKRGCYPLPAEVGGGGLWGFQLGPPYPYSGAHASFLIILVFSADFGVYKNFVLATF